MSTLTALILCGISLGSGFALGFHIGMDRGIKTAIMQVGKAIRTAEKYGNIQGRL